MAAPNVFVNVGTCKQRFARGFLHLIQRFDIILTLKCHLSGWLHNTIVKNLKNASSRIFLVIEELWLHFPEKFNVKNKVIMMFLELWNFHFF